MIPSCSMVGTGGGGVVTITLTTTTASKNGAGSQTATYRVDSDGSVYKNTSVFESWISNPALAGNYQVRATDEGGSPLTSGDVTGSWLALTSDRSWSLNNSAADTTTKSCVLTVEIRDTATSTVRATATITLSAYSE